MTPEQVALLKNHADGCRLRAAESYRLSPDRKIQSDMADAIEAALNEIERLMNAKNQLAELREAAKVVVQQHFSGQVPDVLRIEENYRRLADAAKEKP